MCLLSSLPASAPAPKSTRWGWGWAATRSPVLHLSSTRRPSREAESLRPCSVRQICEVFGANRYPFPEDPARQRSMHAEVSGRIRELHTTNEVRVIPAARSQSNGARSGQALMP